MKISRGKFVHFKLPCLFAFFMFVMLYIAGSLYWVFTENYLAQPSFVEANKCPVCYGESLCETFQNNNIELSVLKSMGFLNILSSIEKTVHYATIRGDGGAKTEVVLKKLGRNRDLNDLDARICSESKMAANCDVSSAITKLGFLTSSVEDTEFAKHLQGTSPMLYCPSTRLISELFTKYKERSVSGSLTTRDKIQIWSTTAINQEPLLLQMFPESSGWPFPAYHGACGRYVVVAYSGKSLSHFYDVDWKTRAGLAYQLMKIADVMTNNKEDFALYLTDVSEDNFVVDASGKVTVIDLEDVLVVDKMAVKSARPQGWDDVHESVYTECPGQSFKSCHSFTEIQLCSHVTSDHNYYVICRYILTRHHDDTGTGHGHVNGLLHDIPEVAIEEWDLEYLLNECVSPKRQRGRIQVAHKLIEALENTRHL